MAIYHQFQTVRRPAGEDLSAAEGCFVTLEADGSVALATATASAAEVYGLLDSVDTKGRPCDIILPGHAGIVGVRLHASSPDVADGAPLHLAARGTATASGSGTTVAIALSAGTAGEMVEARLIEPADPAPSSTN